MTQIVSMLLDLFDCVDEASLSADASFSGTAAPNSQIWVVEASPDIVCFEPTHLALVMVSTVSLGVYTMLASRLIRVGGDLASVSTLIMAYPDSLCAPSHALSHAFLSESDCQILRRLSFNRRGHGVSKTTCQRPGPPRGQASTVGSLGRCCHAGSCWYHQVRL